MTEIKFRAWSTISEGFIEPIVINGLTGRLVDSNAILMQFTGLYDKNDQEIYENDLIKCEHGDIFKVEYSSEDAAWVLTHGEDKNLVAAWLGEHINDFWCNIVGNIYETPELLE